MVALRSRRLEALLGAPFSDLRPEHLRGLVSAGAAEAFDLDFKSVTYGRSDRDRRDLAGDVAAMANTAGGLIVIGIEEDDQSRAKRALGVDVTDAEVRRIAQVVASLVSPIPTFDILTVLEDANESVETRREDATGDAGVIDQPSGHGFILIAVVRSLSSPHAVLINDALRYPRRNGSTTRYLSEPEVAAAYRDRIAGASRQRERLDEVESEALLRLDLSGPPWLVVSLTPDLPGDLLITHGVYTSFQRRMTGASPTFIPIGIAFTRARVGRHRLLADGTRDNSSYAAWTSLELHDDGAGVFGVSVVDFSEHRRPSKDVVLPNDMQPSRLASDESITLGVLSGLMQIAQHARDLTAAGGNAAVRVRLVCGIGERLEIGHNRSMGFGDSRSRHVVGDGGSSAMAETGAALDDLAEPGAPLVATAASLIDELGQVFGIPEMGQLTHDGEVRRRYWGGYQPKMVAWAEQYGVAVVDSTLE